MEPPEIWHAQLQSAEFCMTRRAGSYAGARGKGLALLPVYQFAESKPNYLRHKALLRSQQAAAGDPMKKRHAAGAWATAQCFYLEFLQVGSCSGRPGAPCHASESSPGHKSLTRPGAPFHNAWRRTRPGVPGRTVVCVPLHKARRGARHARCHR